jgi:integrase
VKRDLPPYVYLRKGRYAYFERAGKSQRMPEPGTAEFHRVYAALLSDTAPVSVGPRTFAALVKSYRKSAEFARLKPRTQEDYGKVTDFINAAVGGLPVAGMKTKDVIRAQKESGKGVRFGNYIVSVLSVLFEHARALGWREDNPAKGVRKIKTPADRTQPHVVWPDWAVAKARAEMSPESLLVIEMGIGSVQRPADLAKFTWGDFDGDNLRLTQGKTGVALVLPCTERLKAALQRARDALPYTPLPTRPILSGKRGKPLAQRRMSEMVLAERKRLGLEAFDLHALRYRGVQELAWAGCTDDEIASYSGHMSLSMIRKYAGEARQIMRARQAKEKRR